MISGRVPADLVNHFMVLMHLVPMTIAYETVLYRLDEALAETLARNQAARWRYMLSLSRLTTCS